MSISAKKIAVVTGSRAEYGLLYWVLKDLKDTPGIDLQIIVTGMHLSPEFGMTVNEIVNDGFKIARRVEMLVSSDRQTGIAKSIGLGIIGMSDALDCLQPDVVLVLGDRFEILAAVQACLVHEIPVAHIAGGDVTKGAFDESIRHSITKMSHLHFVTNELAAKRVKQLGEDPLSVHVVGSPGLDHLRRSKLMDRRDLEDALNNKLGERNLLITFHPVTLESNDHGESQFQELLTALEEIDKDIILWFTRPNADTGNKAINDKLEAWVSANSERARIYTSLGQIRYLSLMAHVNAVVGNSSSGLYEAPSFKIPTVNIGDRQSGRLSASSVIHSEADHSSIRRAIELALDYDCSAVINPYGDGKSASRIIKILCEMLDNNKVLKKDFHFVEVVSE